MIRKSAFLGAHIHATSVVPGRVLCVDIYLAGCVIHVLNVHNFVFDIEDSRKVSRGIARCMRDAPEEVGIVASEFNIPLSATAHRARCTLLSPDRSRLCVPRPLVLKRRTPQCRVSTRFTCRPRARAGSMPMWRCKFRFLLMSLLLGGALTIPLSF